MYKNKYITIGVLLVALAAVLVYWVVSDKPQPSPTENTQKSPSYAISGKITGTEGALVHFNFTDASGQVLKRTVFVGGGTNIVRRNVNSGAVTFTKLEMSDLRIGSEAVFYVPMELNSEDHVLAQKIEIIK